MNEERRQSSTSASTRTRDVRAPAGSDDAAMAVSCGSVVCFFCDEKGHYKSDCPEKKKYEEISKEKGKKEGAEVAMGVFDESDNESFSKFSTGSAFLFFIMFPFLPPACGCAMFARAQLAGVFWISSYRTHGIVGSAAFLFLFN